MFSRQNDAILDSWLLSVQRRPLVLRGARQIGKSTAIRRLAERNNRSLVEIDLERHKRLDSAFASLDIDLILQELQIVTKNRIAKDSILFLDEVQGTPHALAALRYFFENRPDLPVVAAGSLLEFALAEHSFSMPVGRVDFARMYPVTFSEYLGAIGAALEKELLEGFAAGQVDSIGAGSHHTLIKLFAEYVLIGGMPAAVADTLAHQDVVAKLKAAALVHERLVEAFRDDFAKYRKRVSVDLLRTIFDTLPAVAGNTKVKYVSLAPNERTESIKRGLEALLQAGLAKKVIHTAARGVPLSSGSDDEVFKLLPLDVGMSSTQALGTVRTAGLPQALFAKWEQGNDVERRWMGQLAECAVGQAILAQSASSDRLHYWLREGKAANAEVDYVVQCGMNIVPIEVKSGSSGALKSLHQFVADRKLGHAVRFDLNLPTVHNLAVQTLVSGGATVPVAYKLHSLPLYLCDHIFSYIQSRLMAP